MLATTVLSFGSLADRIGRRRLFAGGMALFTAASAACGLAPTTRDSTSRSRHRKPRFTPTH